MNVVRLRDMLARRLLERGSYGPPDALVSVLRTVENGIYGRILDLFGGAVLVLARESLNKPI